MDKSDLEWVSEYEVNDRFIYVSDSGVDVDTMIIIKKNVRNSYWPLHWPKLGFRDYEANASLTYIIKNRDEEIEGYISIRKSENTVPVYVGMIFGNRYALRDCGTWPSGLQLLKNIQTVIINNIIFTDCVIMDDSNSQIGDIPQLDYYIENYIWSKSEGLLQYTYNKGEVFTRKDILTKGNFYE